RLPIKVVRIFNTYGPRTHPNDGRVISSFIVQALLNRDITVFGDGSQTRSFCYVDDLVEGLTRMMETAQEVTGPFNLGNPAEFSILEMAQMIIGLTCSRSKIVHLPLPEDDPKQRCPDISAAEHSLGWKPAVSLEEGLARTIKYFEETLASGKLKQVVE
ncbi:MAG: NAD-dependent epimerase/dehydratase family protein, partial [Terriglobales bacterium]